ncbi:MAG: Asp-tRNA(Asn)/Glu-tRNA(Gln) amidotransferase subunit GatC [Burkholderiaceae bacterium]|jgi:aspartyl-tRNA(Asn)/glutamyl-tRNA(Gln) amidotransferase subunit C|nr:Asp-tRNA(Asn)/Glu-tRNA(Gln) amidotransferase subunit GatC [Burkholderiaceae bacterium]
MPLTLADVLQIARLSQLDIPETQLQKSLDQMNDILALVEEMRAVDTTGVEPLSHPVSAFQQDLALRLREDAVTESDQRAAYRQNAPAAQDGLFLVPKVIE